MKKLISLVLTLSLVFALFVPFPASAADSSTGEYVTDPVVAANKLHELKVMNGTGTNPDGTPDFNLEKTVTRAEGITILINLLGVTQEELAQAGTHPFTDVKDWAENYVAYAYNNHLTGGTSPTTFGSDDIMSATQYLSWLLQSLGYVVGADYQWDKAWVLSDKIGLTRGEYSNNSSAFTRGDLAIISCNSLSLKKVSHSGGPVSISKDLMYDGQDIVIKATGIDTSTSNPKLELYYENNTELNLDFSIHAYAVNGVMCNKTQLGTDVPTGKKAKKTLEIDNDLLTVYSTSDVEYVDILFWTYDNAVNYKSFDTGVVRTETTAYAGDHVFGYGDGRQPVYSKDGIIVYADKIGTDTVSFAVYNTSGEYISLDLDNVSINDWAFNTWIQVYNEFVFSGCVGIFEFKIDQDFLESNDIEAINSVEFTLDIRPLGSYFDDYTTDTIKLV